MAKETQKEKIERLKHLLFNANETIERQNKQIDNMIDKADNSFENSVTYKHMKKQIEDLELKLKVANESIKHNRNMYNSEVKKNDELIKKIEQLQKDNIHKLNDEKKHNERGAGRKNKFTNNQIIEIKQHRADGMTIKKISEIYNCSVGLIHKLINE